jgi:hypothetical protein
VRPRRETAREEIFAIHGASAVEPILDRSTGLLGQLELNGAAGFLLNHDGAVADADVIHLQPHEVAASSLAVDGEIEHGEVAHAAFDLKPNLNGPCSAVAI